MRRAFRFRAVAATAAVLAAALAGAPVAAQPAPTSVRFPFPQDDGTLTPYTFDLGYPLVSLIYDTLMWRDADGVPQPWLATSVDTRPDGRAVTIKLHDGVHWQDGEPLTSADVAFTFDYVASHPHPWFTPEVQAVAGVTTPDPTTVVFALRAASPGFVDQPLSDVPILPKHLWDGLAPDAVAPPGLPVGSGPYRLADYQPGTAYRFSSYDDYFRGAPAVKELSVPIVNDGAKTLGSLRGGQIDMVPASLPDDILKQFQQTGIRVATGPSYGGVDLVFNVRQAPFDRAEVRRAVAQAFDLPRIAHAVATKASPATSGMLHPASPWASPNVSPRLDEAAARAALEPLHLPTLDVVAPEANPVLVDTAREVAFALRRAGIAAEPRKLTREAYSQALGENGGAPSFQLALWTSPPFASYDPDFLRRVFGSNPDDAVLNFSGYRSAPFDSLSERIATTQDPAARKAAVNEELQLLAADAPVVPLFFPTAEFAYRPSAYDGWVFVKGTGILDKRSFLDRAATAGAKSQPTLAPSQPSSSDGGGFPFWIIGAAFFAAAGIVGAVALTRRGGR